jgi:Mn-dependent DtxR family transcriptional regulator
MIIEYKPYLTTSDIADIMEVDKRLAQKYMRELNDMEIVEEDEKGNKIKIRWGDSLEKKWTHRNVVKTELFLKRFKGAKNCFARKKGTSEATN